MMHGECEPGQRIPCAVLALSILFLCGCACSGGVCHVPRSDDPSPSGEKGILNPFGYDRSAPLDLRESVIEERDGVVIRDASYAGYGGGRVPAFLVEPAGGAGRSAGIVFLHWDQGDRHEFLGEAIGLARSGAVSLLIDAPSRRPDSVPKSADERVVQIIVDLRRGVDLLTSRPNVDPARIGYVGHSYGATWGGTLAAVDSRIRVCALVAGYARPSVYCPQGVVAPSPSLDPIHFIGEAVSVDFLFQFAEQDEYVTREAALEYFGAAHEPKAIRWYPGGHMLTPEARADRTDWLRTRLGLKAA